MYKEDTIRVPTRLVNISKAITGTNKGKVITVTSLVQDQEINKAIHQVMQPVGSLLLSPLLSPLLHQQKPVKMKYLTNQAQNLVSKPVTKDINRQETVMGTSLQILATNKEVLGTRVALLDISNHKVALATKQDKEAVVISREQGHLLTSQVNINRDKLVLVISKLKVIPATDRGMAIQDTSKLQAVQVISKGTLTINSRHQPGTSRKAVQIVIKTIKVTSKA